MKVLIMYNLNLLRFESFPTILRLTKSIKKAINIHSELAILLT